MAITLGNSNYNGDFLEFLYKVLFIGNEVINKGAARVLTGIAQKRALPKISQTTDPFGDYTSGAPGADTVTTTYAERDIEPQKMTLYEEFLPEEWQDVWDKWQPVGDFTNLMMNPEFMADVIELYMNNGGTQLAKLFWQGDTTLGAGNPLNKFDGIVTRAIADAGVIDAVTLGVPLTKANIIGAVENVYNAMPDKYLDDPDWIINMNTTDFKLLQSANLDAKKTTTGVLTTNVERLFLEKRIQHYQGMPSNYMVGAKGLPNSDDSNLFFGFYVEFTNENPVVNKVTNAGRNMFIRYDVKADANYREATEIVLYSPV